MAITSGDFRMLSVCRVMLLHSSESLRYTWCRQTHWWH